MALERARDLIQEPDKFVVFRFAGIPYLTVIGIVLKSASLFLEWEVSKPLKAKKTEDFQKKIFNYFFT
jgi:hypothetical protein